MLRFWTLQVLISLDQFANALLGGWADETLSSHAHRRHPRLARLIDALFWFDREHCRMSYESERLRLQSPPEMRQTEKEY